MSLIRIHDRYSWIYLLVTFFNNISTSFQLNETYNRSNTTTTTPHPSSSPTTIPYTLPPSCIDKKVWNVCWLKTPPYIFERPNNKSIVEGILVESILKGLENCGCQVELNFTLEVHEETELVNCSKSKNIDLVVPFPHRGIIKNDWFFKVVDSAALYLLLNREKIEKQAKANILDEFSQVWTLAVLTILLAIIFGIIVWSLDSAWNKVQFPPSFYPGAFEGVWWSFVTLTTVGYGDKTPKFPMARIFAVIWMFVGMCMVSLLTATMTKALTSGLVETQHDFHDLKIGVLKNSHTYDEAVKKGAQTQKFNDLKAMYTALKEDEIQGILVDIFIATYVRNHLDLFSFGKNIFVAQSYDIQYSIGFYFGNGMAKYAPNAPNPHDLAPTPFTVLKKCIKSMFENTNRRIDVFAIVEKYIQRQQTVKKSNSKPYDEFKIEINLFAPSSETFVTGLKILCIVLGILVSFGIAWEIIRCRWKRSFKLSKTSGDTIAMSGHQRMTAENIQKMAKKLDEVERALSKVVEFRDMYEQCKENIDKYNSGISNGNSHGTTNRAFTNIA